MKKRDKIVYTLSASLFFVGLGTAMSWAYYTPRTFGVILMAISILISYYVYRSSHEAIFLKHVINIKQLSLGILLIFIDVIYNLFFSDNFGPFDTGIILAGISIVAVNLIGLKYLGLEDKMVKFATYFIFVTIVSYSTLYTGMERIFGTSGDDNPFYNLFTSIVIKLVHPILNIIRPTTVNGNIITFDGFSVGIGYACSGIESLAVFFSAIMAFHFTQSRRNIRKSVKFLLIGGLALYFMNLIRVIIIILVGYFFGSDWLMYVHANLGWIIFVLGMAVFWYLAIDDLFDES